MAKVELRACLISLNKQLSYAPGGFPDRGRYPAMMPAGRAWRRFSVAEVPPTAMPEPGHARPAGPPPDRADDRRAPAAPAPPTAAWPRPLGPGRGAGAERVPGGGARRPPALGALPRLAPAPAGVAPGRGGQGGALRRAGRRRALLRAPAAVGAGLVGGARAGAGGRRDRTPRGRGGAGGQRALPRLGHPGRLGGAARQRAGAVAGRHPPLA